jgi:hypothetical protein
MRAGIGVTTECVLIRTAAGPARAVPWDQAGDITHGHNRGWRVAATVIKGDPSALAAKRQAGSLVPGYRRFPATAGAFG